MTANAAASLRACLDVLTRRNALVTVDRRVDPRGEVTAVLGRMEEEHNRSAALFRSVEGYPGWAIVGSVFADRAAIASVFGVDATELTASLSSRLEQPIEPVVDESGPVQEVVATGEAASLDDLPLVVHHEKDAGRYVSLGLTFVKDPTTGTRNVGIYRYMQRDARTLVPSLTSISNIADIFGRQEQKGLPLDIAIVPGASPAMIVAASYRAGLGVDECTLAGGLQGAPVRLVRAKTVDVEVPADAEVVIEARILPGERFPEAPFADMSRSYSRVKQGPLTQITAITRRRDPILQLAFSGHADATNMAALSQEVAAWRAMQAASSNVTAVHVPASGYGFHCYVAIRKVPTIEGGERGEQRNVMLAALGAVPQFKLIVAFDHDVDVFDDVKVLSALARRFQAKDPSTGEERFLVIPNAKGATYDPSSFHREYPNAKLMIDATLRSDLSPQARAGFDEARPGWPHPVDLAEYIGPGERPPDATTQPGEP
jgi:2,5-furandicarboxylate decarboxylase 1